MKHLFLTLFLFTGFIFSYNASAVNSAKMPPSGGALALSQKVTVNDFIAFDAKSYRTTEGKKLNWTQRLAFNLVKKNLERKVKKGKIDGTTTMDELAHRSGAGGNIYGLLSLIFSVVGLFVPYAGIFLIVGAFVLGLIGIKRDNNPTMAIIGTILSAVALLLILIVIIVGASLLWGG